MLLFFVSMMRLSGTCVVMNDDLSLSTSMTAISIGTSMTAISIGTLMTAISIGTSMIDLSFVFFSLVLTVRWRLAVRHCFADE